MQNFNQGQYHFPHLAWREQTQVRVTELLANGRKQLCDISGSEWHNLKTKWQAFIRAQCKSVTQYQGQPLSARMIKETHYDGFRVQNIVFESMPGWQVGLNLFLPVADRPYVPIICPCGHGPKWQDDHQLPPQVLARNGFAVALFDMPMFGEKVHHNDHFIQRSQASMTSLLEHEYIAGKHMLHPASPPFGPGYPGEHVVYSSQQAPHAGELVDSMVAVGIGPRFTALDVEDVAQAITKVWQALDKGTLDHG
jgi:hypothetical protein